MNLPPDTLKRLGARFVPEPNSGCWLWDGPVQNHGYGVLRLPTGKRGARSVQAHRASYSLHRAPVPDGVLVLHRCDVRCCVNPEHLFLGSLADNMADRNQKGRQARGEQHGKARLTEEQARAIWAAPGTHRQIANRFGVSEVHVGQIKSGRKWKHLRTAQR